jgi:acyl-coenzyme A synthetase/AMP-(fatty) acid ligase
MDMGDLCFITMSSGTTGTSKPIGYNVFQFIQRLPWRTFAPLKTQAGEKTLLLTALPTTYGLITLFGMLWGGDIAYVGWGGAEALRLVESERIHRVLGSTPLIVQMARALETNPADCSSLRQVYSAGDTLPERISRLIAEKMCRELVIAYGANEVGMVATTTAEMARFNPQCVGLVFPWSRVEIVDSNDNPVPPGTPGLLRITSATVIPGYLNDTDSTETRFRGGWFYSGDMGYFAENGMLMVTGRLGNMADDNAFDPQPIENAVNNHPAVSEAAVFGVRSTDGENEIWLAVVGGENFELSELRDYCTTEFGDSAPTRFLVLKTLPRNENGKVMRWKLAEIAVNASDGNAI